MKEFISAGRLSLLLPAASWALSFVLFFTLPSLFDEFLLFFFLIGVSGICMLLGLLGLFGEHKISGGIGFLLNAAFFGFSVYILWDGLSFAAKF